MRRIQLRYIILFMLLAILLSGCNSVKNLQNDVNEAKKVAAESKQIADQSKQIADQSQKELQKTQKELEDLKIVAEQNKQAAEQSSKELQGLKDTNLKSSSIFTYSKKIITGISILIGVAFLLRGIINHSMTSKFKK